MISRILIIEPNPKIANRIKYTLNHEDVQLEVANNFASSLEVITSHSPDVVVIDSETSDFDSENICQLLKNNPTTRHSPVIILDNPSDTEDLSQKDRYDIGDYHLQNNGFVQFCLVELLRFWGYINNTTPDIEPSQDAHTPQQNLNLERVYGI